MRSSLLLNEAGKSSGKRIPKIGGRGLRVLVGGDFCEKTGVVSLTCLWPAMFKIFGNAPNELFVKIERMMEPLDAGDQRSSHHFAANSSRAYDSRKPHDWQRNVPMGIVSPAFGNLIPKPERNP